MLSIQELRSSNQKELSLELEKFRKEMVKIRISLKTKHEKDTSKAGKTKRYIAQVLTFMNGLGKEKASVTPIALVVPKVSKSVVAKAKKAPKKQS